jgi:hypothetical protein
MLQMVINYAQSDNTLVESDLYELKGVMIALDMLASLELLVDELAMGSEWSLDSSFWRALLGGTDI